MSARDRGFLCGRGPPDGRPPDPLGRTPPRRRWWRAAGGAWLAIILALVLYPGTLGAHGLHHPASVTAGGAPAATTVGVVATVVPFLQPDQPAEIFCHDSARAPGKDGSGGRWSKCALCPVLCGGAGPPALLPPEGAPPLHRSTATRRHGPPPRTAVVVTRPHPVASGGGSRAPPPDS